MYSVSANYHNLIASGAEQNLLIVFNDLYLSSRDQDFESKGATLTEYFNTSTDVEIGEVASSTFQVSIMNYEGALSSFNFGEGRPYIGVKTGNGTYTRPSGATAYTVWTDSNGTNHTIVGYSTRATIDGTNISTNNKAVTILWAKDDVVYIQTTDAMYEYQYDVSTRAWTRSEGVLNPDMALKESEGVKWQNSLMTIYLSDGTTEEWEYCPLGVFSFEMPSKRQVPVLEVTAYDRMAMFDKDATPFLNREWEFPTTLGYLYTELCDYVGATYETDTFTHSDLSFTALATFDASATCRDILSYIAEASGSVASFDRDGILCLRWYGETSVATLGENDITLNGYDKAEYVTPMVEQITAKLANGDIYTEGSGENAYTILGNSFLAADASSYAAILEKLQSVGAYTPIVASVIQADPSVESGDRVTIFGEEVPLMSQTITWRAVATAEYVATGLAHRELPTSMERFDYAVAYNASANRTNAENLVQIQTGLESSIEGLNLTVEAVSRAATETASNLDAYQTDNEQAIATAKNIHAHVQWGIIGYNESNEPITGVAVGESITTTTQGGEEVIVKDNLGTFTSSAITFYVSGEKVAEFGNDGADVTGDLTLNGKWAWITDPTTNHLSLKFVG